MTECHQLSIEMSSSLNSIPIDLTLCRATNNSSLVLNKLNEYNKYLKWYETKQMRMIDIGTGSGQLILEIEKMLPSDYSGILCVDCQKRMIDHFDSFSRNSRIQTAVLDIETMIIPEEMKGRFDFVFTSYCFSFVKDFSKVLENCSRLLKPGGEIFAMWCKRNQIYEVYQVMNESDKWSQYTKQYKNWKSQFGVENSCENFSTFMKKFGFEVLKCEDLNDVAFHYENIDHVYGVCSDMDLISRDISKCDLPKYREDFNRIASKLVVTDEEDPRGMRVKLPFPSIAVAAKKI